MNVIRGIKTMLAINTLNTSAEGTVRTLEQLTSELSTAAINNTLYNGHIYMYALGNLTNEQEIKLIVAQAYAEHGNTAIDNIYNGLNAARNILGTTQYWLDAIDFVLISRN
ncbi:MAG: hypothetical protein JW841_09170 [Deltaproteobacteria bacterium]|nr:hypothetical protein [Deltaproteobacteria bacterium]